MTALESSMADEGGLTVRGRFARVAIIALAPIAMIFCVGIVAGILMAHADKGGGAFGAVMWAIIAAAIAVASIAGWATIRAYRALWRAGGQPTSRERRARLALIVSGLAGGLIAMTLFAADPVSGGLFSNAPLPAWVALALAFVIAILGPLFSFYWHRRLVDEQEEDAFRTAAMLGLYAFWFVAPAWWLLWRGGLVAEPKGIVLYLLTHLVAGIGWMWGKYR